MAPGAHGEFSVQWYDQVCLVTLTGCFNREGVLAMLAGVQESWRAAGEPVHWAYVMDLRVWDGGTADGFAASHDLLMWMIAHGAEAIVRLHASSFLATVTRKQGVYDGVDVPVATLYSPDEARDWLSLHGFRCSTCPALGVR